MPRIIDSGQSALKASAKELKTTITCEEDPEAAPKREPNRHENGFSFILKWFSFKQFVRPLEMGVGSAHSQSSGMRPVQK